MSIKVRERVEVYRKKEAQDTNLGILVGDPMQTGTFDMSQEMSPKQRRYLRETYGKIRVGVNLNNNRIRYSEEKIRKIKKSREYVCLDAFIDPITGNVHIENKQN
jgi:hypothetical protein